MIRETLEARRATPAQIHDRSRLVIARAAVARLLPTNWILEDHSSCAAGVEMGQRHPGAHRYGLATAVPNCTRDATAVAESVHAGIALRNYYTGRELSLRTLDIRS